MPTRLLSTRIRVAAIIVEDGKILLARHEKKGKRYWVVPGGGVDFCETLEEALTRELVEEANVVIRVHDLVLANDSIPKNRRRHIVNLYFTAEILSGHVKVGASDKRLIDMRFVPIEKLPRLKMFPDVRREIYEAIRRGFKGHMRYLRNTWKDM